MNHSQNSESELSEFIDPADESDSSSSSSSGDSTSSSSSYEDVAQTDALEMAKITDEVLRLPRGLCENVVIFREFFSYETWCLLPEQMRAQLHEHLPRFTHLLDPDEAANEQQRTVSMLFNGELKRFGQSPLGDLQRQLEEGNCRPDVLTLQQSIAKSRRREQRFQNCERLSQLAKLLFVSRERMLRNTYKSAPPDTALQAERILRRQRPAALYSDMKLSALRARKRFFSEVEQLTQQLGICSDELSVDEDDDELDMPAMGEMQRESNANSATIDESVTTLKPTTDKCIYGTLFKRRHELADEEALRTQQMAKQPILNNRNFRQYMLEHKRRKLTEPTLPDFETSDIRLRDVCARAQMGGNFKRIFAGGKTPGRKPKSKLNEPPALVPLTQSQPTSRLLEQHLLGNTSESQIAESHLSLSQQQFRQQHLNISANSAAYLAAGMSNNLQNPQNIKSSHVLLNENDLLHDEHDAAVAAAAFHMMDSEVELQQEEVETYGEDDDDDTCQEETIPAFLISTANDITLPVPKQANIVAATSQLMQQQQPPRLDLRRLDTMPKLEPISNNSSGGNQLKPNEKKVPTKTIFSSPLTLNKMPATLVSSTTIIKKPPTALKIINSVNTNLPASSYIANPELIQETHACFFSLIRDFFCATPHHRMKFDDLKLKIDVWLRNPITALNDWYAQAESWSLLLNSAISFLAGDFSEQPEEYVPYIEHKTQLNIYQWIGAGRDSDTRLSALCLYWMQRRNEEIFSNLSAASDKTLSFEMLKPHDQLSTLRRRRLSTEIEDASTYDSGITPPPPPRCPTTWTVRAATTAEVIEFQRQERERFEQPHRAYIYRMHGYESIVGPVKGIYSQILALTKARGHSMMIGDRPNFVTILTLVRDATARLPNGEGTRADISELLKCSQYINRDAAENVLQTIVSGALDRMHTEHDPCVRYDPKRKIWIYLHRNRSADEFERMHQQQQGLVGVKHKKPVVSRTKPPKSKPKDASGSSDGIDSVAETTTTNNFALPALVPANPIIVSSQQLPSQTVMLPKCPPVPPLKYNIPSSIVQQQKSLLKTTFRHTEAAKSLQVDGSAPIAPATTTKQFSFSVPQPKSVAATTSSTTPIIVATPKGLQTVHVSNATSVTSPATGTTMQLQSATVGGKKVALNKPIIINQITKSAASAGLANAKTKSPQTAKPQPTHQQPHSFIIPISMSNSIATSNATQQIPDSTPQHAKNIIRLVPANNSGSSINVKSLISTPMVSSMQQGNSKQPMKIISQRLITNTTVRPGQQQPQLQQQKTVGGISIITSSSSNAQTNVAAAGSSGNAVVKMSPQAFASWTQKQGQHILLKQSTIQQPQNQHLQQQRLVVGNTAIIAQPTQMTNKNIILQHVPQSLSSATIAHKNVASGNSQTSAALNISSSPSTSSPSIVSNKIQTINATNLTPQQQRVLLQNLKQQQQQIQFKTVQVVNNSNNNNNSSGNSGIQHQLARSQAVTIVPQRTSAAVQTTTGKTMTVMVSQPQGLTRLLKTTTTQAQQQQTTVDTKNDTTTVSGGTRVLTSSTGQIISLESLLQKQGSALRISGGTTTATPKAAQTTNLIQLATSAGQQGTPTQYAVVSQPRNIITLGGSTPARLITTQAGGSTILTTTTTAPAVTTASQVVAPPLKVTTSGKIVAQPITKSVFGKTIVSSSSSVTAAASTATGGNIRLINAHGTPTGFNIANIQGKQVLFATKPASAGGTVKNLTSVTASQAQKLQNAGIIIGGQTMKVQANATSVQPVLTKGGVLTQPTSQMQTVIMGNQILRVQQMPQTVKTITHQRVVSSNEANLNTDTSNLPKTLVLGSTGQTIRLQPTLTQTQVSTGKNIVVNTMQQQSAAANLTKTPPASRVVLAVQGGGQIFLSPSFQGGSLNLKSLQNMKVVSLAPNSTAASLTKPTPQDKLTIVSSAKSMLKNSGNGGSSGIN